MNPPTPRNRCEAGRPTRLRRAPLVAVATLAVGMALVACGGSPKPDSGSARPGGAGGSDGSGVLAYSTCMRAHGVPNFPDPDSSGGINDKRAVESALQAVSATQAQAAQNACQQAYPGSLSGRPDPTITAQQQQDYLNAAACLRSHGIADFPDPTFSDGHVSFNIPSNMDTHSPQATRALHTCQKLIPAGLPYSASAG